MAIEVKDLRIRNILHDEEGNVCVVRAIDGDRFITHKGVDYHGSASCYIERYNGTIGKWLGKLRGIPLTPEWLERMGFTMDINPIIMLGTPDRFLYFAIVRGELYPVLKVYPEFSNEEPQTVSLNRIESVHQLQNLYHALTGCELGISPETT